MINKTFIVLPSFFGGRQTPEISIRLVGWKCRMARNPGPARFYISIAERWIGKIPGRWENPADRPSQRSQIAHPVEPS